MYCSECGTDCGTKKFCNFCGEPLLSNKQSPAEPPNKKPMTFKDFMEKKGRERTSTFKPKTNKKDKREMSETVIFASMLRRSNDDDALKQVRGSRCPVKCLVESTPVELKRVVYEKMKRYNKEVSNYEIHELKLCYKDGEQIRFIPGTRTPFTLKAYKEDLGVGYQAVGVYLLPYEVHASDDDNELSDDE